MFSRFMTRMIYNLWTRRGQNESIYLQIYPMSQSIPVGQYTCDRRFFTPFQFHAFQEDYNRIS